MYEMVCSCCSAPFEQGREEYITPDRLESFFERTYDPLIGVPLSRERGQLIFSTNYDPSVELWCQKRFLPCIDGTKDINNPEVKQMLQRSYLKKQIQER